MLSPKKMNIILEKVLESSSVNSLEDGFTGLCQNYCVERFSLISFIGDAAKPIVFFNTYPKQWVDHYVENEYYKCDPVFDMVANNIPFFWNGNKSHGLTVEQERVYKEAQAFDVKMGFTIPLFHSKASKSCLTILDNLHLHPEALYSVITASQIYLDKIDRFEQQSSSVNENRETGDDGFSSRLVVNDISLTPRESECLIFLMRGYTAKEVGRSMNLSSRTVECHLDNIKEKTGYLTKSKIIDNLLCNTHNKPILQKVFQL